MNKKVLLCAVVAAIGGLLYGFDTAVINGALPFFTAYFKLNPTMVGWAVSSALVGSIIGAIIIGGPADRYGRRQLLILTAVLFGVSAIGSGLANHINTFIFYRFLGGLAVGAASVLSPMYISEVSPTAFRGRLVMTFQLSLVVGILLAFMVDYSLVDIGENNWRWMFISEIMPASAFFIMLFLVQKSPRWLVQKGKPNDARKVLLSIDPNNDPEKTITEIQETIQDETENKQVRLLSKKNYKFALMGIAIGLFSQFTGIAIVMYYATDIFRMAGYSTNSAIGQTAVLGLTNLIFTIIAMLLIDKIGRKKLLLTGMISMFVFLGLFAFSFISGQQNGVFKLVLLIGFVASFASSMGATVFVLFAEIFPNRIRAKGMALASFSNWLINASITFLFPIIVGQFKENLGIGYCFAFFSAMTLLGYIIFKKTLNETKNKSLEELELHPD
ncbi:MAG: sugar porter family MFS transporter [Maribacter sp.]|nr:sugar porter family MFS transporter [Maribacter sp.]